MAESEAREGALEASAPGRRDRLDLGSGGGAAVVGLVIVALLATCPRVLTGEILFLRDLTAFHRPLRRVLLDLLARSHGLPSWNPFSHFGQPFAANPNAGVFDPWSALFVALPFDLAFNLQVLLPLLTGGAGLALLVRERGGSGWASAFAALAWTVGGCALSISTVLQLHHAIGWLPLALAAVARLARAPSARRVAAAALPLGLLGLAGSPSGLLLSALLVPFAAWDARRRAKAAPAGRAAAGASSLGARAGLLGVAAAVLLGAAVGAASWLPAAAHLGLTERVAGERFADEAGAWSMPPLRLVELAAPRALGHVVPESVGWYWGGELYAPRLWPYLFSLYAGLGALALAVTAATRRPAAELPWLAAGGLGLLLALGTHLPGRELLLRALPPLSVVRYPEKWIVATCLVLVVLAARGLDLVLDEPRARSRARAVAIGLLVTLATGLAAALAADASWWRSALATPDWLAPLAAVQARLDLAWQAGLALALAVLLHACPRRALAPALLLLCAVDLAVAGRQLMPTESPEVYDRPPRALEPLASAGSRPRGYVFQYADWKGHEVRRGGRKLVVEPPAPWQWGIATGFERDFDGTHLAWSRRATGELLALMGSEPALVAPVLERRSVIAVLRPGDESPLSLLLTREARPLAFPAEAVVARRPGEPLAEVLRRLGPASAGTVVLESEAAAFAARVAASTEPGGAQETHAPSRVDVLERAPDRWRIAVRAPGPGPTVVALNTTWHPSWRARVDGEPVPLLRADGHLSAIAVPAGAHVLELEHRPASLPAGLALTAGGLLASIALALVRRRPRGPAAAP